MEITCTEQIMSENYADLMIENQQIPENFQSLPNFCNIPINDVFSVAYVPVANLPQNMIQQYSYSIYPSCFGLLNLGSLDAAGITKTQNIPALNLTGRGVLIGIIDTGIEYTHEAFLNADGTTKIISIWDQTLNDPSIAPSGFHYGTEYTSEQINEALASDNPLSIVPSTDTNGHGTFLAGIAAGNRNDTENFSGIVPDATIVVVKLKQAKRYLRDFFIIPEQVDCYQENDIMFGIKYVLDIARKRNQPISICIGLGSSQGSHDGRHSLGRYIDSVADEKWAGVSIAGGNEGDKGHHYSGTVDISVGYNTVELNVGKESKGFSMELWGNSPNLFSIDISSPLGEYVTRIPPRLKETRVVSFILDQTKIFVDYEIIESQTGDQLILIRFQNPTEGIWRFRVYSSINFNPHFHIWLPINIFLGDDTYFISPDPYTTLTAPANTVVPIIVTAYNHANQTLDLNASRGYTRKNLINPSFAAPGVNLIGPSLNNSYIILSGTSVSAAFSTGVVAMLLEWGMKQNPTIRFDTLEMKNFLIRGAKRDTSITFPNKEWGYGILDVYNAFISLRG